MALERLSLAPPPVDGDAAAIPNGGGGGGGNGNGRALVDGGDDVNRAPRLPRWTRQEILVLIQGKRVAENRVRKGRTIGIAFETGYPEPKWTSVSSYCKQHGVNRGPVQCRKRWSNLAGDYKKIKEWESRLREETESFWAMRNDLRRERKLPGFFDREVYDILDCGTTASVTPTGLALAPTPSTDGKDGEEVAAIKVKAEAVFDSGGSAAAEDGLFSDLEPSGQEEACGGSSEKDLRPAEEDRTASVPDPVPISGTIHGKRQTSDPEVGATSLEGCKRKRFVADRDEETKTVQSQLIEILERNGKTLSEQLESQNNNCQLDREQRKDHVHNLVAVLNKLADALGRIADKL